MSNSVEEVVDNSAPKAFDLDARRDPVIFERTALVLLCLWCSLPLVMALYTMAQGALGLLADFGEAVAAAGPSPDGYVNNAIRSFYQTLIHILGAVTFIFSLVCIVRNAKGRSIAQQVRDTPWFFLFFALLVWSLISTLLADNKETAFFGGSYMHDGYISYLIYAGIFTCASTIKSEKSRRLIMYIFCGVTCFIAVIMCIQAIHNTDFLELCFNARLAVVFNHFNHLGYVLGMATMTTVALYLFDEKARLAHKIAIMVAFAFLLYALLLNRTFGAYIALLVGIPVAYLMHFRKRLQFRAQKLLPVAIFVTISLLAAFKVAPGTFTLSEDFATLASDLSNIAAETAQNSGSGADSAEGDASAETTDTGSAGTGRMQLWRDTAQRITERPIFGFGPEGLTGEHAITNNYTPHNEYLQTGAYLGVPGLVLYLLGLITIMWNRWKCLRELPPLVIAAVGVAFTYLISATFGNPVFNTSPYFWMMLGMATMAKGEKDPFEI